MTEADGKGGRRLGPAVLSLVVALGCAGILLVLVPAIVVKLAAWHFGAQAGGAANGAAAVGAMMSQWAPVVVGADILLCAVLGAVVFAFTYRRLRAQEGGEGA